jgi:1-Cys peroxiredoxin 6
MALKLGDTMPNFRFESNKGNMTFHQFIEGSWAMLMSHPADFTPVCTTELGAVGRIAEEFKARGVKVVGLSCDQTTCHDPWNEDIRASQGYGFEFPIISDPTREISEMLGMLDPEAKSDTGAPLPCRATFIIGPDKKLKCSILYPASTGRNFDEVIRVIDSLQVTANSACATPVNWKKGDDCIIVPALSTAEARELFPKGVRVVQVPSGREYLRYTPDPTA